MHRCLPAWRYLLALGVLAIATAALAVPPGYRYIGSRIVTGGRVVYWYWNAETLERAIDNRSFVARMYARAVDLGQERPYAAEIRCDTRTYREYGAKGAYQAIEDGEPIAAVWGAGCDAGRALTLAERSARLGVPGAPSAPASTAVAVAAAPALPAAPGTVPRPEAPAPSANTGSPPPGKSAPSATTPIPTAAPPSAAAKDADADPRRADACVRFAETKGAAAGEATIANTCAFPVEVTLCYKGGRDGPYDCPPKARGRRSDSLPPGATHVLPDYRRATHRGIALVACRGTMGAVFPRLDEGAGRSGCS